MSNKLPQEKSYRQYNATNALFRRELPDSNNNLEVILQGSFDILLEVKFTSRSQVYLHIMHCQKRKRKFSFQRTFCIVE